jgi:hypothetical protein
MLGKTKASGPEAHPCGSWRHEEESGGHRTWYFAIPSNVLISMCQEGCWHLNLFQGDRWESMLPLKILVRCCCHKWLCLILGGSGVFWSDWSLLYQLFTEMLRSASFSLPLNPSHKCLCLAIRQLLIIDMVMWSTCQFGCIEHGGWMFRIVCDLFSLQRPNASLDQNKAKRKFEAAVVGGTQVRSLNFYGH